MTHWPAVCLREVLIQREDVVPVDPTAEYPMAGVYSFGKGLFFRGRKFGQETSYKEFFRLHSGDLVLSRVKGWEGAVGIVPKGLDGHFVSKEFPVFVPKNDRVYLPFVNLFFRSRLGRESLTRAAQGIGARRERVKEKQFLEISIPLPPRKEQRRLSDFVSGVEDRLVDARQTREKTENEMAALLASVFSRAVRGAKRVPLGDVAPLDRRPVEIVAGESYLELGVRSFGRGVFHKPELRGADLTWQKLFGVREGDIVISNIKAWEGAIAVAGTGDDGRVGSHRYLTLVPDGVQATAGFLCFYLLTPEGLTAVGNASPGSADRNRTLGQKALQRIEVPVPAIEQQISFDELHCMARGVLNAQADAEAEINAIIPSMIDRILCGRL